MQEYSTITSFTVTFLTGCSTLEELAAGPEISRVAQYLPATVKLSVSFADVLRHITVVASLKNILDAVTCRVEVKFVFTLVPFVLTLMRTAVNRPGVKTLGGLSFGKYTVG